MQRNLSATRRKLRLAAGSIAMGLMFGPAPALAQEEKQPPAPVPAREEGEGPYDRLILRGGYLIDGTGRPHRGRSIS
ncbi:hypothetical protein [Parvularcula oceani]|uniref:hypothetical protein n=1 Tax=Parvularcula oceani TaxID=1247963 RepID=UPI00192E3CFD|nr:hypothetical protein [Parvularcula oceani]